MRNLVETRFHVAFNNPSEPSMHKVLATEHRMMRASIRSEPVGIIVEIHLENWFERHSHGFLNHLVPQARYAQGTLSPVAFVNHDAAGGLRLIYSTLHFLTQTFEFVVPTIHESVRTLSVHAHSFAFGTHKNTPARLVDPVGIVHEIMEAANPHPRCILAEQCPDRLPAAFVLL